MAQNTIPIITNIPQLAQWQSALRQTLIAPVAPPIPANFTVASKQGGNYLQWAAVKGADGYVVEVSSNGDFSVLLTAHKLPGNDAVTHFDAVPTSSGAAPSARYYRVRGTSGTQKNPQSVVGRPTAVLTATAIAPNDAATASTSIRDTSNLDKLNVGAGSGSYRSVGGGNTV